jgi:hypothetical protein
MDFKEAVEMFVVFGAIVMVVKIISDATIRRRLIDKGMVDEKIKYLYNGGAHGHALSNVKWGIVMIGIGVAALLSWWFPDQIHDEGTLGLMFIFAGIGFLTYYFLLSQRIKSEGNQAR